MDTDLHPTNDPVDLDPAEFEQGWALFGTDFTAHWIVGHVDEGRGILLTAACGVRQHMHRSEAISAPLFRCLDCIHLFDVPVEP